MSFFFHKFKHSALIVFFFRWRWCNKERNILCQSENRHLKPMFFQKCTFLRLFFIKIQTNPFFFCFLMTMVSKIKQNGVAIFWNTQLVMKAFQNYSFFVLWDKNECAHSTQNTVFSPNPQNEAWISEQPLIDLFFFFPAVCLESPLSKVCQISKWCVFVKLLFWMLVKL